MAYKGRNHVRYFPGLLGLSHRTLSLIAEMCTSKNFGYSREQSIEGAHVLLVGPEVEPPPLASSTE